MSKHTPGPWIANLWSHQDLRGYSFSASGFLLPLDTATGDIEEAEANACLIAAVTDLLAAAELVLAWYEAEDDHSKADFYQRMQMCRDAEIAIRAAIAKARGKA